MLSQAVEPAIGAEDPGPGRQRSSRDRPAAYHLRRADCLARAGDDGQARRGRRGRQSPPVTALRSLPDRPRTDRRTGTGARPSARSRPRCGSTPTSLGPRSCWPSANSTSSRSGWTRLAINLNACINSQPDLTGLYLLRALVARRRCLPGALPDRAAAGPPRPSLAAEPGRGRVRGRRGRLPHRARSATRATIFAMCCWSTGAACSLQAGRLDRIDGRSRGRHHVEPPALYQAHATLGQLYQQAVGLTWPSAAFGRAIDRAPTTRPRGRSIAAGGCSTSQPPRRCHRNDCARPRSRPG